MQIKIVKNILKQLDKKSLRKVCFSLLQEIDDYEIQNFYLEEKISKLKTEKTKEQIRADATEIRSEATERLLLILTDAIKERGVEDVKNIG
ncbi:MAG: hypothetical protein J6J23_01995 [Clostridia bacterium]|nr:hypothetical protein [Clostridia bacterium]